MSSRLLLLFITGFAVSACSESGPAYSATNTEIFAPMPGQTTGVAYLAIENHGNKKLTITHISSPQFSRVEMHETVLHDGVARMQPLASPVIDANATLLFSAGGKHVMLFSPKNALIPGSPVALHVHFDSDDILVIETMLKTRQSTN